MKIARSPLPVLGLVLLACPALAGQAYTWTDRDGVTHFSESVPADRAQDAGQIELQSAPVIPGPTPERFRAINEQSARMAAERRKREQMRNKRRQLAEKEQQLRMYELEDEQYARPETYYYPYPVWGHPRYWRRHPHRPDKPPRDGKPPRHDKPPRHGRHHAPAQREFRAGKTLTQKLNAEALRKGYRRYR